MRQGLKRCAPYGPRGYAMVSLALVAILRAVGYFAPHGPGYTPVTLRELATVVPTPVWGVLWGVTGIVVFVAAFRRKHAVALAILSGMSFLWAAIYIGTAAIRSAHEDASGAWLTAVIYAAFAVIVIALGRMINPVKIQGVPDA